MLCLEMWLSTRTCTYCAEGPWFNLKDPHIQEHKFSMFFCGFCSDDFFACKCVSLLFPAGVPIL